MAASSDATANGSRLVAAHGGICIYGIYTIDWTALSHAEAHAAWLALYPFSDSWWQLCQESRFTYCQVIDCNFKQRKCLVTIQEPVSQQVVTAKSGRRNLPQGP